MGSPSSGVRKKPSRLLLDSHVVLERHVGHLHVLGVPLVVELDLGHVRGNHGGGLHLSLGFKVISHLASEVGLLLKTKHNDKDSNLMLN